MESNVGGGGVICITIHTLKVGYIGEGLNIEFNVYINNGRIIKDP